MIKLTSRQQQVLDFIKRAINDTGFPPTRAEIAAELGFRSANAAEEHLRALARKGMIEMVPGTSRGIRLPEDAADGLPIIGRVAAGSPILAEQHIDDYCALDPHFFSPAANYLLRVHGDSMINAGIFEGDLLAVHRIHQAHNGQIIVARIDNEVTVKRFHRQSNSAVIQLLAENPDYQPIEVDLRDQNFSIEGLSVGIIRQTI
ncbi:MAG: transcriptional repressor LexA [Cellvibrionaceae bacterium]|nr:transcriptional repressor LexA [Cellvibrionaceae bacterium]